MKLKKRLDCGPHGFHVATIPKAPRSIRRRVQPKKTDEDGKVCAFELLASLARQLLQETEGSSASSNASGNDCAAIGKDAVEDVQQYEDQMVKTERLDRGSCEVSSVVSESALQNCNQKCLLNEFPPVEDDDILEPTSKTVGSNSSGKVGGDLKSEICKRNTLKGNFLSKVEGASPNYWASRFNGVENAFEQPIETKAKETDVKLLSCRDPLPNASFSQHRNYIKLGSRDDDDNLSRFNKFSNKLKVYRPVTRIGYQRIRKLLTSKYWKVAPKLKDFEHSRTDGGMRPLHRKRKTCYNHERCHRDVLYKRGKFYDRSSVETFNGGFSCESVTNSPENGRNREDKNCSGSMLRAANGMMTSLVKGQRASLHSQESKVKFRIKSFKVPEIFIEVSETATIGSLKRTVMDAVTAILGGGIRVGVLLHGKKVRDDNRTLSQTGLASEDNLDTLGFTLDPGSVEASPCPPVCREVPTLLLPNPPKLVARYPETPDLDSGCPNALTDPPPLTRTETRVERNHEQANSHTEVLTDTTFSESRALVPVPAMNIKALAVAPLTQKSRRSEIAQRRTRRPFSVTEVEALVHAVEELGTGRWRDVKLRSFENANHRTYVDLKDKWKTLVHTARISPQQRRGEPVPQDLLDRVLAAHAYWCHHHQGKHQASGVQKIEARLIQNGVTGK